MVARLMNALDRCIFRVYDEEEFEFGFDLAGLLD